MTNYDDGYIYVMHMEGTEFYKIGKSISPDHRNISVILPMDIVLVHKVRTNRMHQLETFMHKFYKSKHVRGEWYRLDAADMPLLRTQYEVIYPGPVNSAVPGYQKNPTPLGWGGVEIETPPFEIPFAMPPQFKKRGG